MKINKIVRWMGFVLGVLFCFGQRGNTVWAENTSNEAVTVYEIDSNVVKFWVEDSWEDSKKISVSIENKGNASINNWSLAFDMRGKIIEIWDAKVCAQVEELYVIKNVEYNQDILPGEAVTFGFIVEIGDEFTLPKEFLVPMKTTEVNSGDFKVEIIENSEWKDGYSGEIVITNISEQTIEDWELEIAMDAKITSLWNGILIAKEENVYRIGNMSYNQNIEVGEKISVGFLGDKQDDAITITRCVLTEVTTAEVVDNIVEKEIFEEIIPITTEYFISPLYAIDGNVAAYLVQYYDEMGKGCSYIVVSNAIESKEKYYIEFGNGEAPIITELRDAYLDYESGAEYRILYLGGYDYYIESSTGIYGMRDGEICKIKNDIFDFFKPSSEIQYYNEQETLKYSDILALEVGYLKNKVEKKLDATPATVYVTDKDTAREYQRITGKTITDHCKPTAATNLLIYLSRKHKAFDVNKYNFGEIFVRLCKLYGTDEGISNGMSSPAIIQVLNEIGYNSVLTDAYSYVSWKNAKKCIDKGAVLLGLYESQIYWDEKQYGKISEQTGLDVYGHEVLGVGYISFSHSTGWTSKYYQIVDGWFNDDYRYVNHSLGIGDIMLEYVGLGTMESPHPTPILTGN